MGMVGKATPNQCKYIWSFELRFSADPKNKGDWFKYGITKQWAQVTIEMCEAWEKNPENNMRAQLETRLQQYNNAFRFKDDGDQPAGQPPEQPVRPPIKIDPNMTTEQLFEAITELNSDLGDLAKARFDELATKPIPEIVIDTATYYKPGIFDEVHLALQIKKNTLVYGPAGCGKSRMAAELAKVLKLEFFPFSFSGGQRYAQVFGGTQMLIDDGQQVTKWVPGELLQAVQRPCLILLDEIYAGDADLLLGLNALLQDRCIMTPIGMIKVHEDVRFLGCANTNGRSISRQYTGAQRADDSLSDRFVKVSMDYDKQVELHLIGNCAREGTKDYFMGTLAHLRAECRTANIAFDPSTRRLISAIELANAGLPPNRSFEMAFLEDLSPSERAKVQL